MYNDRFRTQETSKMELFTTTASSLKPLVIITKTPCKGPRQACRVVMKINVNAQSIFSLKSVSNRTFWIFTRASLFFFGLKAFSDDAKLLQKCMSVSISSF